jgi:hypothetical protein
LIYHIFFFQSRFARTGVAVRGLVDLKALESVEVDAAWTNISAIELWPGFASLRDEIKLKIKTATATTVGAVREQLSALSKSGVSEADLVARAEADRLAEQVRQKKAAQEAADRAAASQIEAARVEAERLAELVRQQTTAREAADRLAASQAEAARAEAERLAELVRQQRAALKAVECHEQAVREEAARRAEEHRKQVLCRFSSVRDAIVASPLDVPPVLSAAIVCGDECLAVVEPQGSLVHAAASVGSVASAGALLTAHPSLAASRDETGRSPLHVAARGNHVGMIDLLRASVEAQSTGLRVPLHEAAEHNRVEFVRALLDIGVNVDAVDEAAYTPLTLAAYSGAEAACVLLMERGANLSTELIADLRPSHSELADKLEALARRLGAAKLVAAARSVWIAERATLSFTATATLRNAATVERIRRGTFDPADRPVGQERGQRAARSHAVGAWSCGARCRRRLTMSTSFSSEQEALGAEQSPLFLLGARAHARAARRHRQSDVGCAAARLYRVHAGGDEWLTSCRERRCCSARRARPSIGASRPAAGAASALEQRWAQLSAQLTAAQRKPMDELLKLTGLDA